MSYNRLIKMEKTSFQSMAKLKYLDLSHNYLDGVSGEYSFENFDFTGKIDLSFNLIKRLGKDFFASGLNSLNELDMSNNDLKRIENFSFKSLISLESLDLGTNALVILEDGLFSNLTKLVYLNVKNNHLRNLAFLKFLINLEHGDLSYNQIEIVHRDTFSFSPKITSINLNSNRIKHVHELSLKHLKHLNSLKISRNHLNLFNMSILNMEQMIELDLSFTRLEPLVKCENVQTFILRNVTPIDETFLNSNVKHLVFSYNSIKNFSYLNAMHQLEWLELREVSLKQMSQINFENFPRLTHLDLAFNSLKSLEYSRVLQNLVYLDLSHNRIEKIASDIFGHGEHNVISPLKYLNLEFNEIVRFENDCFLNYLNLEIFKASSNRLIDFPNFEYLSDQWLSNNFEFYFNSNQITMLKSRLFTLATIGLRMLNLDFNQIQRIDQDALLNLRNIENLSFAYNNLSRIERHYFLHLFSLKHLNLASNQIMSIEFESFINLNKLLTLDLSFNLLTSIEAHLFAGLSNLNDLHLTMTNTNLLLSNRSFSNLTSIGNFYLNDKVIVDYTCLFAHSFERSVQRVIENKFSFFKSINLITDEISLSKRNLSLAFECELKLHLLQFKIHFNLKTDEENEFFYEKCHDLLILKKNSYKSNLQKCFLDNENNYYVNYDMSMISKTLLIYNPLFLMCIFLLLSLFLPVSLLIYLHLVHI
jgi:Leucine-rich repeat (LRR) protein